MNKKDLALLLLGFILVLLSIPVADSIRWLSLATSAAAIQTTDTCDSLRGLVKRQKKICRANVEVMDSVRRGAHMAIEECQYQFKNRRWNCSTVDAVRLFGNVLKQGTRETSFVHAIASAGVAHAVTRACSSGVLNRCGCDRTVRGRSPEGFEWSGCSDNVDYGVGFSRDFVDAREKGKRRRNTKRSLMNLHNNEAGRKTVQEHMKVECKCHGVSGSCELRTCWKAMPSFRVVGEKLKEKFDGATEVEDIRKGTRIMLAPKNAQFKPHTQSDLVYLTGSPDFCEPDNKTGSFGTHGRVCNKTSKAIDGCELMCCGRGYRTEKVKIRERCMCKFHWCCYVKCKECERIVEVHTCS